MHQVTGRRLERYVRGVSVLHDVLVVQSKSSKGRPFANHDVVLQP